MVSMIISKDNRLELGDLPEATYVVHTKNFIVLRSSDGDPFNITYTAKLSWEDTTTGLERPLRGYPTSRTRNIDGSPENETQHCGTWNSLAVAQLRLARYNTDCFLVAKRRCWSGL